MRAKVRISRSVPSIRNRLQDKRCSGSMRLSFACFSSRRRHTRCCSDWSSDVCSSDLKKGFDRLDQVAERAGRPVGELPWAMPYLPIDPKDVGRSYEAVIRVNSQSGKGGVAYIMKSDHHLDLPRRLQIEFSHVIQRHTDDEGGEVGAAQMSRLFAAEYLEDGPYELVSFTSETSDEGDRITTVVRAFGAEHTLTGTGNGPIAAFCDAVSPIDLGL